MFARLLSLLAVACVCNTQSALPLHFEWANPIPHRQSWRSMAAGNGAVVGLTEGFGGRSIYTWTTEGGWRAITSPTNAVITKVVFANGQFVAVGANSTVISSKDGIDWKLRHTDAAGVFLTDLAIGNGVYVGIIQGAYAIFSSDLVNWKVATGLGTAYQLFGVEFGNGRFMALGQYRNLLTSVDGASWTSVPWPASFQEEVRTLTFNCGIFMIGMSSGVAVSTDGVHWTVNPNDLAITPLAHGSGFLGISPFGIYQSPTGAQWTKILTLQLDMGDHVNCSAYLDGTTFLGGDKGLMYKSADLVNWERLVKGVNYQDTQIAFGNGLFVRYGGASGICISSNGGDWQRIDTVAGLKSAVFGNGVWVGFDVNGNAAISNTGKTWETISLPAVPGERLLFADGLFVGGAVGGILTSVDGRTWQFVPFTTDGTQVVGVIGRANSLWVAASNSGPVTSPDGLNWTMHPPQDLGAAVHAAGNGRFIGLVGGGMGPGYCKWSTDGVNWQTTRLGMGATTHQEQSLTFANGLFVLTDNYGGVFESEDGLNWSGERQAEQVFTSSAFGNGQWMICGGDSILQSSARMQSLSALKLQLVKQEFNTWSLTVAGSAGETFNIETCSELGGQWEMYQTVTIPESGQLVLPTEISTPNRFFRAKASAL